MLGVTAVLADGSILTELSGLVAGSSGYDLAQLLTGSEGTLAVITAARLRLWPADPVAAVLLAGVAGIEPAAELCQRLRANVPGLRAAEYLDEAGLEVVCQAAKLPAPLDDSHRGYLLAEIAGDGPDGTALDLKRLVRAALPSDTAIAQDGRGQAALWAYRERLTEAIATAGIPHKIDVAVPAAALGAFRAELDEVVRAAARRSDPAADRPGPAAGSDPPGGRPDARRSDLLGGRSDPPGRSPGPPGRRSGQSDRRSGSPDPAADPQVIVFGHIGVGNLHVNVLGPDPADDAVDVAVARLAAAHGGSVAAEHGVGRAKTGWLSLSRSPAEISAMRAIKTALDPAGLLNPGVLLPPGSG